MIVFIDFSTSSIYYIKHIPKKHGFNDSKYVPPEKFTPSWIPEGYVLLLGPDNEKYLVPNFMEDSIN